MIFEIMYERIIRARIAKLPIKNINVEPMFFKRFFDEIPNASKKVLCASSVTSSNSTVAP
jgi:hypothetical protein